MHPEEVCCMCIMRGDQENLICDDLIMMIKLGKEVESCVGDDMVITVGEWFPK